MPSLQKFLSYRPFSADFAFYTRSSGLPFCLVYEAVPQKNMNEYSAAIQTEPLAEHNHFSCMI